MKQGTADFQFSIMFSVLERLLGNDYFHWNVHEFLNINSLFLCFFYS